MTNAKYKYWKRRRNGLCVACGKPVDGTARCVDCAKRCSVDSYASQKRKREAFRAEVIV